MIFATVFLVLLFIYFLIYRYVNSGVAKGNAAGRIDNNEIKNRDLNQLMEWVYATPQEDFGGRTEGIRKGCFRFHTLDYLVC
jgi:hypothetical protein